MKDTYTRFFLTDGTFLAVFIRDDGALKMAGIFIDVNGQKAPNKFGRDIFYYIYYIRRGTNLVGVFMPSDYDRTRDSLINGTDSGTCNKNASDWSGRYCAALIMKDGWQIKDDYPW